MNEKHRVMMIIDMDPGIDDALNLIWISKYVKQGMIDLVAVTSTSGNVNARNTFRNSYGLLKLLGIETKVGIQREPGDESKTIDFHGDDGLGGLGSELRIDELELENAFNTAPDSVDLMIESIQRYPGKVILLATGPLTNIAKAEKNHLG